MEVWLVQTCINAKVRCSRVYKHMANIEFFLPEHV